MDFLLIAHFMSSGMTLNALVMLQAFMEFQHLWQH